MIKRILKFVIRKFRINVIMYKLLSKHEYVNVNQEEIYKANNILENLSADPGNSCITENHIDIQVDLQIIVPVYNAEKYLRECLDSVVKHEKKYTYRLTCINDGSSDSSAEILKEYENNPNVEIITQENKGFSGARNSGLKNLVGKYITFLDSDDYLDWNGVEKMLDIAFSDDLDLVQGSHTRVSETGKIISVNYQKEKYVTDSARNEFLGQPWAKIFKAHLFSNIEFPENYWFEDSIMSTIIYYKINKSMKIADNVYYYRENNNGITKTSSKFPKSIDSVWITKRLYTDRQVLGLKNSQNYYEYILRMVKLTYIRTRFQDETVKKSVFILFSDFIKTNFSGYNTQYRDLKELEKAMRTMDYGYYKAYCKYM